jgi:hypothetical protein
VAFGDCVRWPRHGPCRCFHLVASRRTPPNMHDALNHPPICLGLRIRVIRTEKTHLTVRSDYDNKFPSIRGDCELAMAKFLTASLLKAPKAMNLSTPPPRKALRDIEIICRAPQATQCIIAHGFGKGNTREVDIVRMPVVGVTLRQLAR